jgi:hypothetical protein
MTAAKTVLNFMAAPIASMNLVATSGRPPLLPAKETSLASVPGAIAQYKAFAAGNSNRFHGRGLGSNNFL